MSHTPSTIALPTRKIPGFANLPPAPIELPVNLVGNPIWTKGWDGLKNERTGEYITYTQESTEPQVVPCRSPKSLAYVLNTKFAEDEHFQPFCFLERGVLMPRQPRVNQPCWSKLAKYGMTAQFTCVILDGDDPLAHANKVPSRPEWRAEMLKKLAALPVILRDGMAWYMTLRGIRILWLLDGEDFGPEKYLGLLISLHATLKPHDLTFDYLTDWVRVYRAPHATRLVHGEKVQQDWPKDLTGLGPLRWRPDGGIVPVVLGASGSISGGGGSRARTFVHPSLRQQAAKPSDFKLGPNMAGLSQAPVHEHFCLPDTIPEGGGRYGGRNKTLFMYGCSLVAAWDRKETLAQKERSITYLLLRVNKTRCQPPMEPDELATLTESVLGYKS